MNRFLHSTSFACASLIGVFAFSNLQAVNITFDIAADYDQNFWEANNTPAARDSLTWNNGGYVSKTRTTDSIPNATSALYNSTVTGGSNGSGGTTPGAQLDRFSSYRLEADVSFTNLAGASFGFLTNFNDSATNGSLLVYRLDTSRDVRFFTGASAADASSAPGTQQGSAQNLSSGTSFAANTQYTFRLDVIDNGTSIEYIASVLDLNGNSLANSITFTDNNPTRTEGQVGIRLGLGASGANETQLHRFSVAVIPEPSTYALMGGMLALGLAIIHRKRRKS